MQQDVSSVVGRSESYSAVLIELGPGRASPGRTTGREKSVDFFLFSRVWVRAREESVEHAVVGHLRPSLRGQSVDSSSERFPSFFVLILSLEDRSRAQGLDPNVKLCKVDGETRRDRRMHAERVVQSTARGGARALQNAASC